MRITNYFTILNEVEILIKTNKTLQETIQNMQHSSSANSKFGYDLLTNTDLTLKMQFNGAIKNSSQHKAGYRHDQTTKMFAAYIRMLGGRILYETLHASLYHFHLHLRFQDILQTKGPTFQRDFYELMSCCSI